MVDSTQRKLIDTKPRLSFFFFFYSRYGVHERCGTVDGASDK